MYEEEKVIEVSKEKSNTSESGRKNRFFEKYAEKGRVIQTRIIIDEYITQSKESAYWWMVATTGVR